jgi:hypothetical protein
MNIGSIFSPVLAAGKFFFSLFSNEEKAVLEFFAPLIKQVKDEAVKLGKGELEAGLRILKDAALQAAMAAAVAPPGTKVAIAEATFLRVGISEGITEIHNAEAGAIKAAVAIVQQEQAAVAAVAAAANVAITATPTTTAA